MCCKTLVHVVIRTHKTNGRVVRHSYRCTMTQRLQREGKMHLITWCFYSFSGLWQIANFRKSSSITPLPRRGTGFTPVPGSPCSTYRALAGNAAPAVPSRAAERGGPSAGVYGRRVISAHPSKSMRWPNATGNGIPPTRSDGSWMQQASNVTGNWATICAEPPAEGWRKKKTRQHPPNCLLATTHGPSTPFSKLY